LLHQKFQLGLFDNPYVDETKAREIPGQPEFRAAGELAQRKSIILLKNAETDAGKVLPLSGRPRVYVENMNAEVVQQYADVVDTLDVADFAILRLMTPFEPRSGGWLERYFHHGDLDFKGEEKARILNILKAKPTIVDIFQERPAVIPEIAKASAGLLSSFGVSDEAVLDVIFGKFNPVGKLPFEMPSSMEAVRNQKEDVPYDSENPLYEYGFGLGYE
jgi:beta-glucosidase